MADPALEELLRANPAIWRGQQNDPYQPGELSERDESCDRSSLEAGNSAANLTQPIGQNNPKNQTDSTQLNPQNPQTSHLPGALRTGFTSLDHSLPAGGWQVGTLTELIIERNGCGEFSLLLPTLRYLTQQHWVALVQPPYIPYAPALSNAGVRLERTLIVDTDNDTDTLWSAEQLLRSGLFAAVVCWVGKTSSRQQRRLQLAAETGQAWAVTYRPVAAIKEHSPAALRLHLSAQHDSLLIDVLKSRGMPPPDIALPLSDFDASQGVEWPGHTPDNKTST